MTILLTALVAEHCWGILAAQDVNVPEGGTFTLGQHCACSAVGVYKTGWTCLAGGRQFAVAVVEDVKVLISCGRPAVVCAVTDLRRLFAAAVEEAKAFKQPGSRDRQQHTETKGVADPMHLSSPGIAEQEKHRAASKAPARQQRQLQQRDPEGSTGHAGAVGGISEQSRSSATAASGSARASGRKKLRQQLQAAERRLVYFQSWANEQTRDQYQHILEAVAEASRVFEQAQDTSSAPVGQIADMSNRQAPQASKMDAHQASGRTVLHKPLVQEHDGSSNGIEVGANLDGSFAHKDAEAGAEYDTLD